jgi:hypothetical protein
MKPIEIVFGFLGIFGAPAGAVLVLESPNVWQLKAVAIVSLCGLLWHSFQRFRAAGIIL